MWLGVDYYPEQWDSNLMDTDMDTIKEMGCNVIRIAEFSWHLMEKTEGQYDFSFFDQVISRAKEKELKVIMGTPTATIPAWLAKKHPSILSQFEIGQKRVFGVRHVYCFNSPEMYQYSEKIIRALVEHYKGEKQIAAWQMDNVSIGFLTFQSKLSYRKKQIHTSGFCPGEFPLPAKPPHNFSFQSAKGPPAPYRTAPVPPPHPAP